MKKRFLFILVCMLHAAWASAQFSGSGSGMESDPYLIFNETQLSQMGNFLNQDGVVFRLMKDLDLTSFISENSPSQGWQPIGVSGSPFKGKLLGNNKTISGLTINRSTQYVGFFGYLVGATVNDLTIKASTIKGSTYTGILAGYAANVTLSNVTIASGTVTGGQNAGGLLGYASATTVNTYRVVATVKGTTGVGGVAGQVASSCSFKGGSQQGTVTATSGSAGGFAGIGANYTLSGFTAKGNVTCSGSSGKVAGLVGSSSGTVSFTNSSHAGDISGATIVGGIVGSLESGSSATFTSCAHKGEITNTGDYTGGIVAKSDGASIADMQSCSHFGDITGKAYVGGLVGAFISSGSEPALHTYQLGSNNSTYNSNWGIKGTQKIINGTAETNDINNCTAIGSITGANYVGGLIGRDFPSYSYSQATRNSIEGSKTYCYLWIDGVYDSKVSYSGSYLIFYYYDYQRNTTAYSLTNNYYSGTLQGSQYVGGLVGQKGGGTLQNNYSYANIYGSSDVGGIVGSLTNLVSGEAYNENILKSNISNCAVISAITANVGRIYGSIAGSHNTIGAVGSNEGNRALTTTQMSLKGVTQEVADNAQNGTSIGPSLLRLKATYVAWGWDFNNDWDILETESYPYKRYQAAPPVIESTLVSQATAISGKSVDGGTVHLYYKGAELGSTECDGNNWAFSTEALQSGALVRVYADVEGKTPSYFTSANVGFTGSGTEDDPWRIYTAEDLQGATKAGYYKLMNDIDLSSWIAENSPTKGWLPIGHNGVDATYIDGDGHKVTGLWTNTTEDYTGLFSNFSAGQIKNLNVEIATGKQVKGGNYTGGLIGSFANGEILNCTVTGNVQGTQYVGGIVGTAPSTALTSLSYDGTVKATAASAYVGGIAGNATGAISACTVDATVTSTGSSSRTGGLVGYAQGTITGSHAIATVTSAGTYVGGLVGYAANNITKCLSNSSVTASGSGSRVGGLVGYTTANVSLCLANGTVTATGSNAYTGGIVGYSYKSSSTGSIANCYSTANVSGTEYTAGLVGYAYNTVIDKCYAKGDISGVLYGGGLVGELEQTGASLTNSVALANTLTLTDQASWGCRVIGGYKSGAADPDKSNYALSTMQVSLNNVPQRKTDDLVEGIAKTQDELQLSATYMGLGWDFANVWAIDEGEDYPTLRWESERPATTSISLDKTSLTIVIGNAETLTPTIRPNTASQNIVWRSDNTNVATVADGVVTAVGIGSATITATTSDGTNLSATCTVTVTASKSDAIAELNALVADARTLYDNSTEGEDVGQYEAGSRAELLAVINSVNARISADMTFDEINACTGEINAAMETFRSSVNGIGEVTDISQMDNAVYIEPFTARVGEDVQIEVKLKNAAAATSYGFELVLPEGMTINVNSDNEFDDELELSSRNSKHSVTTNLLANGNYKVGVASMSSKAITGNDGTVMTITAQVSAEMSEGDYAVRIVAPLLVSTDGSKPLIRATQTKVTVESYVKGDVDGDGVVDLADAVLVINYYVGKPVGKFMAKAADVDGDGSIDLADAVKIINFYVGKVPKLSPQAPAEEHDPQ